MKTACIVLLTCVIIYLLADKTDIELQSESGSSPPNLPTLIENPVSSQNNITIIKVDDEKYTILINLSEMPVERIEIVEQYVILTQGEKVREVLIEDTGNEYEIYYSQINGNYLILELIKDKN